MGKSDSLEHLPDVITHKGDIAFQGESLILWEPERAEMPRSGNFREYVLKPAVYKCVCLYLITSKPHVTVLPSLLCQQKENEKGSVFGKKSIELKLPVFIFNHHSLLSPT